MTTVQCESHKAWTISHTAMMKPSYLPGPCHLCELDLRFPEIPMDLTQKKRKLPERSGSLLETRRRTLATPAETGEFRNASQTRRKRVANASPTFGSKWAFRSRHPPKMVKRVAPKRVANASQTRRTFCVIFLRFFV